MRRCRATRAHARAARKPGTKEKSTHHRHAGQNGIARVPAVSCRLARSTRWTTGLFPTSVYRLPVSTSRGLPACPIRPARQRLACAVAVARSTSASTVIATPTDRDQARSGRSHAPAPRPGYARTRPRPTGPARSRPRRQRSRERERPGHGRTPAVLRARARRSSRPPGSPEIAPMPVTRLAARRPARRRGHRDQRQAEGVPGMTSKATGIGSPVRCGGGTAVGGAITCSPGGYGPGACGLPDTGAAAVRALLVRARLVRARRVRLGGYRLGG